MQSVKEKLLANPNFIHWEPGVPLTAEERARLEAAMDFKAFFRRLAELPEIPIVSEIKPIEPVLEPM